MTLPLIGRYILRHALYHRLRTALTIVGIGVSLFAFTMIQTMISSWYAGVDASAKNRLIVRNAVSLVFYLPISYVNIIRDIPGVSKVGHANWFGGVYKDEKYRFAQFAVSDEYIDIYPEFLISKEEREAFRKDRKGVLLGQDLVESYGLKIGEVLQIKGSIFPGLWEFTIRGIIHPRDQNTVTRTMLFHWDYLNERNKLEIQRFPDHSGFIAVQLASGANAAEVSKAIDDRFQNSFAETLTETETAFQQSFISMSSSIIVALQVVSFVVVGIMLLVLTNTMLMSSREKLREYAVLKALGFGKRELAVLVFGESFGVVLCGFMLLLAGLLPIVLVPKKVLLGELINFFPKFEIEWSILAVSFTCALAVGLVSGAAPLVSLLSTRVTEGLRRY